MSKKTTAILWQIGLAETRLASAELLLSGTTTVLTMETVHDTDAVCEAVAAVRFDSGVLATLCTAETYGNVARFEVQGANGTLAFVTNPWLPERGENRFSWTGFNGDFEEFVVTDPLDAFDHQVRMVEANIAAGRLEAERPSPRLQDSRALMAFLTEWEALARGDNIR